MRLADNSGMRAIPILSVALIVFSTAALGRIGETTLQFVARYGPPKDTPSSKIYDKNSPLVEGAIHHIYEYQGWKIRAAFLQLDGPAVRMDYSKLGSDIVIKDYELQAIVTAETPAGMTWTRMAYDNPNSPNKGAAKALEAVVAVGQKMWRRSDGAILWLRGNLIIRLELPIAREHEAKLKADKDQKARASVPQF
jgi:ribosomal protein L14